MTNRKPATPLKVAGEVQMKALSHDMGILRRENERLVEALAKAARQLRIAADGVDQDHPMNEFFVKAAAQAMEALPKRAQP